MTETNNVPNNANDAEAAADTPERRTDNTAQALDAKLSGPLAPLEAMLSDIFGKKAPVQLPDDIKKLIVSLAPWLSLLAGIAGILSAVSLWRAAHYVNEIVEIGRNLSRAFGTATPVSPQLGVMFWLSIVLLLVFSALALLAFPGLKAKKKIGWNFMFYGLLVNIVYSFASLFYSGGGAGTFVGALIGSVIGLYILFQVREHFRA